jgi:hypothetical protein
MNIIHLLYMNNKLNDIKQMYEKLSYVDQYGGSLVLFIIITMVIIILITYFYTMSNLQPIINDWQNQRCKPNIIPIAGLITHPEGITASEYTAQNFTYCTQNILSSITGFAVEPLTFVTNMLTDLVNGIQEAIQDIRAMFNKIRTLFQEVSEEIMGRIMNIMIPLQQIIISFRDLIGKIQGSMTAGLFTLLGTYYTLQSLMGAIAQFIIIILIILAALIAMFWIFPFTWGFAITNTAIFIAIAVPMAIILAFMVDVLQVNPDLSIPTLSVPSVKCFDKNTLITMNNGTQKRIIDINVGDILSNNNVVTSKIKVTSKGSIMYLLDNIIVSDSHIVKCEENWIPVSKHPLSCKYDGYDEDYLYCLNTTEKIIKINNTIFTDWDEIYDESLNEVVNNKICPVTNKESIHKYLDCGFSEDTKICVNKGKILNISKIKINDILENGEKVYGIVQINGFDINEQFRYNLGENNYVDGYAPNLICNKEKINNNNKLYHLLTDQKTFKLYNKIVPDYNNAIDRFLETNK